MRSFSRAYYKGERGNKPYDLKRMLRIYLVQNPYNLLDMATVTEMIDSRAFSDFCGVESSNQVPDGDTLGRFRNLLIRNNLQEKLFAQVVELLAQRGLILKKGTIVDSTFIESPSSTKNRNKQREPEAHSAKKGNTWHFGYKAHIGADSKSGLVHTVKANCYKLNRRPSASKKRSACSKAQIKRREHEKSSVRARVEHVFAVVKQRLRFCKTRYQGLRKQIAKLNMRFALADFLRDILDSCAGRGCFILSRGHYTVLP